MTRIQVSIEIAPLRCPSCGVHYGIDERFRKCRETDGKTWYCPNGHSIVYRKTEADRLRAELTRTQDMLASTESQLARRSAALTAQKRESTRLRTRIANGVCPCCHRSFVNVQRHMASQHPDFERPQ